MAPGREEARTAASPQKEVTHKQDKMKTDLMSCKEEAYLHIFPTAVCLQTEKQKKNMRSLHQKFSVTLH